MPEPRRETELLEGAESEELVAERTSSSETRELHDSPEGDHVAIGDELGPEGQRHSRPSPGEQFLSPCHLGGT